MAIGTLAAIGIGAAVGGSVLGASSKNKAASKAADVSLQVAQENNALARDIYGQNKQTLSPYVNAGLPASSALNSFLGLTPMQTTATPAPQQPNAMGQFAPSGNIWEGYDGPLAGAYNYFQSQQYPSLGGYGGSVPAVSAPAQPSVNGRDAFKTFIDNSDYAFQFGQGANKVNSGYAGAGTLQSGAAMKALEQYRQNLQQGYRGEFLNALANQQGVGLSGASALAGVGQNYVNTISANNNSAGTAQANAILSKGSNNPLATGLGALGGILSGFGR